MSIILYVNVVYMLMYVVNIYLPIGLRPYMFIYYFIYTYIYWITMNREYLYL